MKKDLIIAMTTVLGSIAVLLFLALLVKKCYKRNKESFELGSADHTISSHNSYEEDLSSFRKPLPERKLSKEEEMILQIFNRDNQRSISERMESIERSVENFHEKNSSNSDRVVVLREFVNTEFEKGHDFIQYWFPNGSKSGVEGNAPFVPNPFAIKNLIKEGDISNDNIILRFANFSDALNLYCKTVGITNLNEDRVYDKIRDTLINDNESSIQHNQFRITRMIVSVTIHFQFLQCAEEVYKANGKNKELNDLMSVKETFYRDLNKNIMPIFHYIKDLKVKNFKAFDCQMGVFIDLVDNLNFELSNKRNNSNNLTMEEGALLNNLQLLKKSDVYVQFLNTPLNARYVAQ